ncbi:MAG TPA: hypothetical protein PK307_01360 [Spirochaetota bacterium]|nr:hypothetical protein [Spirochaetota bacterium]
MQMHPLIIIACIYAAAIVIAEMTLGNAAFPLHFWYFTNIPSWHWSVPVHGAGFIWMLLWTRALRGHPALLPISVSWAFFAAAEAANRYRLMLFDYGGGPLGAEASFASVLVLYAALCGAVVYAMRRYVFNFQE